MRQNMAALAGQFAWTRYLAAVVVSKEQNCNIGVFCRWIDFSKCQAVFCPTFKSFVYFEVCSIRWLISAVNSGLNILKPGLTHLPQDFSKSVPRFISFF